MKTPSLFLGLPVDRALENQLQKNNQIASLFINESDEQMLKLYLVENLQYLGKWVGRVAHRRKTYKCLCKYYLFITEKYLPTIHLDKRIWYYSQLILPIKIVILSKVPYYLGTYKIHE